MRARRVFSGWTAIVAMGVALGLATTLLIAWGCDAADQRDPASRKLAALRAFALEMPSRRRLTPAFTVSDEPIFFLGITQRIAPGVHEAIAILRPRGNGLVISQTEVEDVYYRFRRGMEPINPTFRNRAMPTIYTKVQDNPFPRPFHPRLEKAWYIHVRAVGWPCACLGQAKGEDEFGHSQGYRTFESGALLISGTKFSTLPIWSGLIANVGIFAAAWILVLGSMRTIRRAMAHHAGRCGACGYDLRGLPPNACCPECGLSDGR